MTKTNDKLITRSFITEFRQNEEDGNRVIGRPVVYGKKTDLYYFEEIIERGALEKTNLEDVLFFVNHDINKIPLARSRKNSKNSTMKLKVDQEGLEIDTLLDTENNSEAKNLRSAIDRGDITGMSFMFTIDDEEWENLDSEKPLRRIKSISRIIEVSAVNFPAYKDTSINARENAVDTAKIALENARAAALDNADSKNKVLVLRIKNENILL